MRKNSGRAEMVKAVKRVLAGRRHFNVPVPSEHVPGLESPHMRLSSREYAIMQQIARGKRLIDIAREMHVSANTVGTYRRRILNKLGLESAAEVIRYVIDHKLE